MIEDSRKSATARSRRRRGNQESRQAPRRIEREEHTGIGQDERGQDQPKDKETAQR